MTQLGEQNEAHLSIQGREDRKNTQLRALQTGAIFPCRKILSECEQILILCAMAFRPISGYPKPYFFLMF